MTELHVGLVGNTSEEEAEDGDDGGGNNDASDRDDLSTCPISEERLARQAQLLHDDLEMHLIKLGHHFR